MKKTIVVSQSESGKRIDAYLTSTFSGFSRSHIAREIKKGNVSVNGEIPKPSYLINFNDTICVNLSEEISEHNISPEAIDLNIVFENDDVVVINKMPGMVVHPAAGNKQGTLVNALLAHFPAIKEAVYEKGNPISEARPGLVHRLDKDTSGVIIVAKNARSMHSLAKQIQSHTVTKKYLALCYGWPKQEQGRVVNFLGRHPKNRKHMAEVGKEKGREAISDYKVIDKYKYKDQKISLVEFDIHTGRTHQIRVQAKEMATPVLGDQFYGNKQSMKLSHELRIERQMLHAKELDIVLPGDNKASHFVAEPPKDFKDIISKL